MNCARCREHILATLAAGQRVLKLDAAEHLQSCARCSEYFYSQRELFRSIDAGLRSLVNKPVPASLLPGVRMRLDEQPSLARNATFRWQLAAVSAAVLLAVGVSYSFHQATPPVRPSADTVVSKQALSTAPSSIKAAAPLPQLSRAKTTKQHIPPTPVPAHTAPEVIVSAEERQAFARFLADSPEPADMAALARAAQERSEDAVEIALLQIKTLEVKPLDETASE
jgi:predicted anti-sigma-YlaC factor YlaD